MHTSFIKYFFFQLRFGLLVWSQTYFWWQRSLCWSQIYWVQYKIQGFKPTYCFLLSLDGCYECGSGHSICWGLFYGQGCRRDHLCSYWSKTSHRLPKWRRYENFEVINYTKVWILEQVISERWNSDQLNNFWTLFSTYLSSKLDSPLIKTLER